MFCAKCGSRITNAAAQFCPSCGARVPRKKAAAQANNSKVTYSMRCPMCDGVMNLESKNVLVCPYCGHKEILTENPEISRARMQANAYKEVELEKIRAQREMARLRAEVEYDMKAGASASDILMKLTDIDMDQPKHVRFFHKEEDIKAFEIEKQKRKIQLIKTYPLPQSFAGLLDFFQLAESCIDVRASRHIPLAMKTIFSSSNKNMPGKDISDAWLDKYTTIFDIMRAKHFRDPRFRSVEASFERTMQKLNKLPKNK